MELLLLAIYALVVWLVFFKLKLLPWNKISMVIVITIPIVALATLILLMNVFAPSSTDVRVINYVVQVVPRVTGRVIEVPVEPNRLVRKGEVLFRIDPQPFEYEVARLKAQVTLAEADWRAQNRELEAARAQIDVASNRAEALRQAIEATRARLTFTEKRLGETTTLAERGAGDRFEVDRYETEVKQARADLEAALSQHTAAEQDVAATRAKAASIRERIEAKVDGEPAAVAQLLAQLRDAEWNLAETVVTAPTDGFVINLQLRPGSTATAFPTFPVMTFVEQEQGIIALFHQNELYQVEPGNEAEIALETHPGEILKCTVDSIIWAQGQGQLPLSGTLPQTGALPLPEGRFAVKLNLEEEAKDLFLAAGARGHGAIYTKHLHAVHILRKVLLRVHTKVNYLVLKLH
jgi:multidrug resistance efflux pump